MAQLVEFTRPDGSTLCVNPSQIAAVGPTPDRENRTSLFIGSLEVRVVGTFADVMRLLGLDPLVKSVTPDKEPPPAAIGLPPANAELDDLPQINL